MGAARSCVSIYLTAPSQAVLGGEHGDLAPGRFWRCEWCVWEFGRV